jgi:hypothetical protein
MSSSPARPELSDDDDFETEIVGESFRQDELHELASRVDVDNQGRRTFVACLRPEPENTHDKNAVAVLATDNGAHLGYLSRDTARTYHHALLQCGSAEVPAILFGGNERKPHIGVWLDLTALNRTLGIESPSVAVRQAIALSSATAVRLIQPAQKAGGSALDPHGQPLNISFNRARRAERDLCELLGLARGLIADGIVTEAEASLLRDWVGRHPDAVEHWAVRTIHHRLLEHFADGVIDDAERADLRLLLDQLVSGELSATCNADAATTLPLDQPPPTIEWIGMTFVFTGKFAFGTRRDCEREVETRGGICDSNVTKRTSFLVIGTFGSTDWVHSAFGRKIERAVSYRQTDGALRIVAEDHWASAL